jgi:hypothetical protein
MEKEIGTKHTYCKAMVEIKVTKGDREIDMRKYRCCANDIQYLVLPKC